MKLIYTNENIFLVNNVKNIIENAGIAVTIKNEFSSSIAGEVPFDQTWPELWVLEDSDFDKAMEIVDSAHNHKKGEDWFCNKCGEANGPAFEICWQCQKECQP